MSHISSNFDNVTSHRSNNGTSQAWAFYLILVSLYRTELTRKNGMKGLDYDFHLKVT